MTLSEREYLEALEQRVRELEQTRKSRPSRTGLLLSALLVVAVLSGAVSGGSLTAVESRLAVLESLIRLGQDSSLEVKAPFKVMGGGGKILFRVAERGTGGLVNISTVPNWPGAVLSMLNTGGKELVSIGVSPEGNGKVVTLDANGKVAAQLSGVGLNVHDTEGKLVAGVTRGGGVGRIGIWRNEKWVTELTSDEAGNGMIKSFSPGGDTPVVTLGAEPGGKAGALTLMNSTGKVVASMKATPDASAGMVSVMNSAGKAVAGLTAGPTSGGVVVVANAGGVSLAQMSISADGRGLVQVFGRNQNPIAVLTQATEYPGGLLQIYNSNQPVANLTVAQGGGGLFQLSSSAGVPTVEAGTLQSGRGMVRVGPQYKCNSVKPATPVLALAGFEDCLVGSLGQK